MRFPHDRQALPADSKKVKGRRPSRVMKFGGPRADEVGKLLACALAVLGRPSDFDRRSIAGRSSVSLLQSSGRCLYMAVDVKWCRTAFRLLPASSRCLTHHGCGDGLGLKFFLMASAIASPVSSPPFGFYPVERSMLVYGIRCMASQAPDVGVQNSTERRAVSLSCRPKKLVLLNFESNCHIQSSEHRSLSLACRRCRFSQPVKWCSPPSQAWRKVRERILDIISGVEKLPWPVHSSQCL